MSPSFLQKLAQARPDPGGGAAAAYGAQVALALLVKIIRLEAGRPREDHAPKKVWADRLATARRLADDLKGFREKDVWAYGRMANFLVQGRKMGKEFEGAVVDATNAPWQIMCRTLLALELVADAGAACRPHLLADLLVAAELLGGALQGAHHIAKANLPLFPSQVRREEWAEKLSQSAHEGLEATLKVRSQLLSRAHAHQHHP